MTRYSILQVLAVIAAIAVLVFLPACVVAVDAILGRLP